MDNKLIAGAMAGLIAAVTAVFYFRQKNNAVPPGQSANSNSAAVSAPSVEFLTGFKEGFTGIMETLNLAQAPRGIRNNNPLNIKWVSFQVWNGQTGQDSGGFVIFDKPENGIRAAVRTLTSYKNAGYVTPRQIVTRWTGGDSKAIQDSYVSHICAGLGIYESEAVQPAQWFELIKIMIKHENGQQPYSDQIIKAGIASA